MARKSTPTQKAARMLDLVPYISTHQGISVTELANEFGISEEELLSDLNALWMCGDNRFDLIDLDFDSGYVSIRNAQTLNVTRSLSKQEIISLLIGLDLIEKDLPDGREDLRSDLASVRRKLDGGFSHAIDASPAHDGQIFSTLQKAVATNSRLHIRYFSPSEDSLTEREISPLHIFSEKGREFLLAFCEKAQSERTFRCDRIQLAEFIEGSPGARQPKISEEKKMLVKVKISKNRRKSRESLGEILETDDDHVMVSTYGPTWLSRTVISAAGAMEVTSSPEIRAEIVARAEEALKLYR